MLDVPSLAAPPDPVRASSRPRVLVIAEACNPQLVSVPLVAWSHYLALREVADVHLVTHPRNAVALQDEGLVADRDFTLVSHDWIARPLYRLANLLGGRNGRGWTLRVAGYSLSFPYFEQQWWAKFERRLRNREFDLVHQLSPLSPTTRIHGATRCRRAGIPFVWGPINGGVPWPKGFGQVRRQEREWLGYVREGYKLLPGYRAVRRDAAAILVGSRDTWRQMPRQYRERCLYLPENGVAPERFSCRRQRKASRPLRLVFLGRLVPYKGPDMALEAARPLLEAGTATLMFLGDGPLRADLERQAVNLPGVRFAGWVEHQQVQDRLCEADALVFPSIREFGGGVALEAMAVGLPPVVVDYAGPAELVTPETGWLVPLGSRQQIVAGVRQTLEQMAADPSQIDARSAAAHRHVWEKFTWQAKASQTRQVYDWLLGRSGKPDFAMPQ